MSIMDARLNQQEFDRIADAVPGVSVVSVYREHIDARNAVEYTIYFRVDDGTKKIRADLWIPNADLIKDHDDPEDYIRTLVIGAIRDAKREFEAGRKKESHEDYYKGPNR